MREFACKKCGVVVGVGEFCDCKPMGCYVELKPLDVDSAIVLQGQGENALVLKPTGGRERDSAPGG